MEVAPLKILQASAGSGKTFSLAAHYLTLLFAGRNKYREILAVTFTNKATEEMKSRILEVLKGFAQGSEKYKDYREIVLTAHPQLTKETLQAEADIIYRKILHDYNRFAVSTIDGFVQKVIRSFAFELGLDSAYALEMNYDKVKQELAAKLDKALDTHPALLQWIIDLAKERISEDKGWNYRRELIELANELFKEQYQPFEHALNALESPEALDTLFVNYNTDTRTKIAGFKNTIQALAREALEIFLVECPDPAVLKGKSRSPLHHLEKIANGEFSKITSLDKLIDQEEAWLQKGEENNLYEQLNPTLKKLSTFYHTGLPEYILSSAFMKNIHYLRLMQEMAFLLKSYRDEHSNLLISDAQNLLKGLTDDAGDNPSFIWEKMGNRYKNFLFDEFQDTSANQWTSFKPLLTNAIAMPDERLTDHLIVGDTKQSIYRWRNGDWKILHKQAKNDIGHYNVVEDSLAENYRSAVNIIDFNNNLYLRLPALMQAQLNAVIDEQDNSALREWWHNNNFNEIVTDIYKGAVQQYPSKPTIGGNINFSILKEDAEGNHLTGTSFMDFALIKAVAEIQDLISEKGYLPKDICLLVRTNKEAIRTVEVLMENGINVISGEALLINNNNAVKLILNTLKVLIGLPDNTALFKANCIGLYTRLQGKTVQPADLFALKFKQLSELQNVLPAALCNNWQTWIQQPLPGLIEKIIDAYGLNTPQHKAHIPYLFAFQDLAGNFVQQGERGISSFLNYWEEEGGRKALPAAESTAAVQVITIHKSKGLAFRAVLVPFCNWSINGKPNNIFWVDAKDTSYAQLSSIPLKYTKELSQSSVAKAYLEELLYNNMDSLNMLYVATTRAKDYLYISTPGKKTAGISTIGDLVNLALEDKVSPEGTWQIEAAVTVKNEQTTNEMLELPFYPSSGRLSLVFDANFRGSMDLAAGNGAGRTGTILHEILARTHTVADLKNTLEEMLLEGIFKEEEMPELEQQALKVLSNTDLQQLLHAGTERLSEKSIVDAQGKAYRPDKIIFNEDGVIVIDYKFTTEAHDRHIEQVNHYRSLLIAMGHQNVQAYLFYSSTNQLKQVS